MSMRDPREQDWLVEQDHICRSAARALEQIVMAATMLSRPMAHHPAAHAAFRSSVMVGALLEPTA